MSLRNALAWSVSGQFLSFAISFAGSVFVTRLLTPHDLGVYSIALAIISVLNAITAFGLGSYVVRAVELGPSTLASAFTVNLLTNLAVSAVIFLASLIEEKLFDHAAIAEVILVLAFAPLFNIPEFLPYTMLHREMNFRTLAWINSGKVFAGTLVTVTLAWYGYSFMSLAYGSLAGAAFGTIIVNVVARHHAQFSLSFVEARQIARFGLQMMSIGGVGRLAQRFSDIILGNLLGLAALGLYSRASTISNLIYDNVYGSVTRVFFVQLSADYRERGLLRDVFLRGIAITTALLWPMLIGLAVLARPAVYILFGERWLEAALPLSLLMIAQFIVLGFGLSSELFILRQQTARQLRLETIRAIVGVLTFTAGCFISISAAALGRVLEAAFGFALYAPQVRKMAETTTRELGRIYANGLALTLAAVLPSFLLMIGTHWSHTTSPLLIGAAIACGLLMWFLLLKYLKHPLLDEMRLMGRKPALPAASLNL